MDLNNTCHVVNATLETIQVMRRQEESAYLVTDYLASIPSSAALMAADATCRSAMMKWCYQVADACGYNHETVAMAMSCLDRFLATPVGRRDVLLDRDQFQLAAMTALYLSIKIHECRAMDAQLMSSLSHYSHSPRDIEVMESKMLQALQWRVNPPTAYSFVRAMVQLLPYPLMDDAERETILEMTILQLDAFSIATNSSAIICGKQGPGKDPSFFSSWATPASCVAFAALLNAVESVVSDGCGFGFRVGFANFETTMTAILRVDKEMLQQVRTALYEAIHGTSDDLHDSMADMDIEDYVCASSPTSPVNAEQRKTMAPMNGVYGRGCAQGSPTFVRA